LHCRNRCSSLGPNQTGDSVVIVTPVGRRASTSPRPCENLQLVVI
jgi:hypothetical protein